MVEASQVVHTGALWQVESLIRQFDFIDQFDSMDVRLERIHGCRAVDDILTIIRLAII